MRSVTRWDPFADFHRHVDRLFDEGVARPWRFGPQTVAYEASFPVEVSETEDEIEVKASIPGVKPDEVEITVQDDVLTIKAEHKDTTEEKKRDYYRREIRYGAFHRSMTLPVSVDSDKAEATYQNGILQLRLPKAEALRPKQIKVGATNGDNANN
jgi:HSP20 family protein